jgi:hypothetical protein
MIKKKQSEICRLLINIHLIIDKPNEQIMIQSFLLWNKKHTPRLGMVLESFLFSLFQQKMEILKLIEF